MRKKVLIVFPDTWLAFSPSTLNLYDSLNPHFDVTILAREPEYFSRQRVPNRTVQYVQIPTLIRRLLGGLSRVVKVFGRKVNCTQWMIDRLMLLKARIHRPDIAIGVDFLGLWIAQRCSANAHLLSLEANRNHPFVSRVDFDRIVSVVIQSEERYEYLFPGRKPKHFIVQNAPVYRGDSEQPAVRAGLVFCGTAIREFGIFACLDFVKVFPEYTLTVHGAMPEPTRREIDLNYRELLESKRLILDQQYLELDEMPKYLSKFMVGFCLYDFRYEGINTFNYHTAPSGKLFAYFAAGVPVVCSNVRGFQAVADFDAGALIDELTPDAIRSAIQIVMQRHLEMSRNCLAAAKHFSFDKAIAPFTEFLRLC